jgi:nucleoside-diphosphate-sugar epimerase
MPRIVVTGADGFIGRPLTEMLTSAGHDVIAITRKQVELGNPEIHNPAFESAMRESQAVIHLAGRAHVTREVHDDPLAEFRKTNVNGTISVAQMAARAGVTRFVFVSSIGVLGNNSGHRILSETDAPSPIEPYAISKWETEERLRSLAKYSEMQITVVRPPLVYGPNVKGNFLRLLRLVRSGVPLPFAGVLNCRSYIGVHNLCDFLSHTLHPSADGHTFNVADGEDVSTPELLKMIAAAMGRKPRLFRCPPSLLHVAAVAFGYRAEAERLTSTLRVETRHAQDTLKWRPPRSLRDGITEMVRWFVLKSQSS